MAIQFTRLNAQDWFAFNKLPSDYLQHLKILIDQAREDKVDYSQNLAGNISQSLLLKDPTDYVINKFFGDFLKDPQVSPVLQNTTNYKLATFPSIQSKPLRYSLKDFWVNFQKRYEFNPIHSHNGLFSFVIWVQIPYDLKEEQSLPFTSNANEKVASSFGFVDSTGNTCVIPVDKTYEGVMCLFPATLKHMVYPFYTSEDVRISVSGNVTIVDL
ncbi:putative 2OG-Fe(II) oxygenase [Prochlorococcus sp. MIT 1306]|uniref:putative 2OG-Fe(II) oxygenase n=1 Tax=Prochlorococcus sp. MIT 1306 TaxID=1799667 RepID=UPI0007B351A6|nr:putative 2OG-Fe(II) oxygenase [Prochlorococcus sp. MIT 1306]KZR65064.1 hypothetical protein PMIT1306_00746 [Prochlorococcus sp. MIT 1306]